MKQCKQKTSYVTTLASTMLCDNELDYKIQDPCIKFSGLCEINLNLILFQIYDLCLRLIQLSAPMSFNLIYF